MRDDYTIREIKAAKKELVEKINDRVNPLLVEFAKQYGLGISGLSLATAQDETGQTIACDLFDVSLNI